MSESQSFGISVNETNALLKIMC